MKKQELLELLEEQYPAAAADVEDFIGLQVDGKDEVKKVLVTLDTTLDVINQAVEQEVDMIITHHPLIFGEMAEVFAANKMIKAKYDLLKQMEINLFVIHTNSDWNHESIAWAQAIGMNLSNIRQLDRNLGVIAEAEYDSTIEEIVKTVKDQLNIKHDLRTNVLPETTINNIMIGSGASGDLIYRHEAMNSLFIVGELKHHEWIYANENAIAVLEIGHYSEVIFKDMMNAFLEGKVDTVNSKEENGYRTI